MNIVVVGAGGVGGYFGGRLAEAGLNVIFYVRGKTLEVLRTNGLIVKSINGDFIVRPKATDKVKELGNPDLIILCVKSWQVIKVAKTLLPIINRNTVILPLQNGANNVEKLKTVIDVNQIIAGYCKVISKFETPGVINHMGAEPEVVIGEVDNAKSKRIHKIQTLLQKAKFKTSVAEDIHLEIWKKFLFIATISGLGGLTRVSLGVMRNDVHIRKLLDKTADEIIAVALKKGIKLDEHHKKTIFTFIDNLKPDTTASMQRDIMAGRPSELQDFNGYIVSEGIKLLVDTPINTLIYNLLLPMETQARKLV